MEDGTLMEYLPCSVLIGRQHSYWLHDYSAVRVLKDSINLSKMGENFVEAETCQITSFLNVFGKRKLLDYDGMHETEKRYYDKNKNNVDVFDR
jgi:hypothetical protein